MSEPALRRTIYVCFLLSGAAGLIYEVVWARQLSLFLGITSYAYTAVITAYMAGLAAGSVVIGRRADRLPNPLMFYAWLEVGVAAYAALTPWLFPVLQAVYANAAGAMGVTGMSSHLTRFTLALLALLVPTFLMGGTLPLLVRGFTRNLPELGRITGRLYGINTLGATLGTFAAGFLLLPALGVRGSVFVGVALNLGVAAVVMLTGRQPATEERPAESGVRAEQAAPEGAKLSPMLVATLLIGFAVAGFASLLCQLAWIRALILVVGSSVYAFSTTLTSFLAGLGLGSLLYGRFLSRGMDSEDTTTSAGLGRAAALSAVIGFSALLGLPLIGQLPRLFLEGYAAGLHEKFFLFQGFIFVLSALIMIVPTLCMGALFPLITVVWTRSRSSVGRGVGTAYAINTGGTIVGSLIGGLLLLPTVGVHRAVVLGAGLYVAVAVLFWWVRPVRVAAATRWLGGAAILAGFAFVAWAVPPWDKALMSSGVFFNAERMVGLLEEQSLREITHASEMVYYQEGIDGTVSVLESGGNTRMVINGKTDASSPGDLPTQVLLGALPILIHPGLREVLVIGLGSGISVGSVAAHTTVERIEVLEISPEVVAASDFFADEHGRVLEDPRVELIVADARNYLLARDEPYDAIVSAPSNPWISGISNLFTQDFFEMAAERLAEDGIMAQWFQMYSMSNEDLKIVLHTFQSVFPHVSVWMSKPGDLLLVGSKQPHGLDHAHIERSLSDPDVHADLSRIGVDGTATLVRKFLLYGPALAEYTADRPLNTDDRPRIEFNAPRNLYAKTSDTNLIDIVRFVGGAPIPLPISGLAERTPEGLDAPGLGLTVRTDGEIADGWNVDWSVNLQLVGSEAEGSIGLLVGGQRLLRWQDKDGETLVQAQWLSGEPSPEDQQVYLATAATFARAREGRILLPGGQEALWALGHDQAQRQIVVAMTWYFSNERTGVTRYGARRRMTDPGEADWQAAVSKMAAEWGRFPKAG
jgi:spermidine synthase